MNRLFGFLRHLNAGLVYSIKLRTLLSPEQCEERLAVCVDKGWFAFAPTWRPFAGRPATGRVNSTSLHIRKTIYYRNSFQSSLRADIRSENGYTIIEGRMEMPTPGRGLFLGLTGMFFVGGVVFFVVSGLSTLISVGNVSGKAWIGLLAGPGLIAVALIFAAFIDGIAASETRFLTEFLIRELDAEELK